jgi:thiamine-phosphate kinase
MNNSRTEIASLGEFGFIHHLIEDTELYNASTVLGAGDDAAVIDSFGKQLVVSTDMLVEGVHFDMVYTPLKHLGYKSVVVNLSDVYAMNAVPTQITVTIAVSNRYSVEAIKELYEGIHLACERYQVDLIGGDTTSSTSGLIISITAIGEVTEQSFVTRDKAQINDLICVTGNLGAAYFGLLILEREKKIFLENPKIQPRLDSYPYLIQRFLKPEAQRAAIELLHENSITPTAMIDISDGLSSELHHLAKQSGVGCLIFEEKIPFHEQTKQCAEEMNIAALTAALNGGEDYEILFTLPPAFYEKIKSSHLISVIGPYHFSRRWFACHYKRAIIK